MRFGTLSIENFCSIRTGSISFENQGLMLVTGCNMDSVNADSNGSGKSLILEALVWCLFGTTVRGIKDDEVLNRDNPKNCKVSVEFFDSDTTYRVERFRKHTESAKPNDLLFWVNGKLDTDSSMSATQDKVVQALGVDFTSFCAMMPGAGIRVAEMTDSQIKELLERLLQTEVLGRAHTFTKGKKGELESAQKLNQQKIDHLTAAIEGNENSLRSMKRSQAEFRVANSQKIHKLQEDLKVAQESLQSVRDQLNLLSVSPELLVDTEKHLDSLKRKNYETELESKSSLAALYAEERSLKLELRAIKNSLDTTKAKLSEGAQVCPTCKNPVDLEFHTRRMNSLQVDLEGYKLEASRILDKISSVSGKINMFIPFVREDDSSLVKKVQSLRAEVGQLRSLETKEEFLIQSVSNHIQELENLQVAENPYDALVNNIQEALTEQQKTLLSLQSELSEVRHDLEGYQFWEEGFSRTGIRSLMLDHVVPVLNDAVSKYLKILTQDDVVITFQTKETLKNGTTKEKFNISVDFKKGGTSYKAASSGEKARANLAIALAIGDLAAMRVNKKLSFIFLDEPFESVDESGTTAIVNLLQLHKEKFESVFVITHQDYFKNAFDRVLVVTKKDKVSEISYA